MASLTVFVCGTFSDLGVEREAALDSIIRLQLRHDSMEFFGARAEQPIETCLEEVRKSDVLVVIVGHLYGSIVPNLGISYSEAEYDEGFRLGKPCLVYMRDENVPVLPRHMERHPEKLRLLEKWKATLQTRHTVATFPNGEKLALQVAADLGRTIQDLEEAERARAVVRPMGDCGLLGEIESLVSSALQNGAEESSLLSAIRKTVSSVLDGTQGASPTVFLSYAAADTEIVMVVAERLRQAGIRVSLDTDLSPRARWLEGIERQLTAARFVIFFMSPNSVKSEWARQELQVALHRQLSGEGGALIIPVLLADADVPPLIRQFQWLDMRDGDIGKGVRRLVDSIQSGSGWRRR